jgi:hypothetical protein
MRLAFLVLTLSWITEPDRSQLFPLYSDFKPPGQYPASGLVASLLSFFKPKVHNREEGDISVTSSDMYTSPDSFLQQPFVPSQGFNVAEDRTGTDREMSEEFDTQC